MQNGQITPAAQENSGTQGARSDLPGPARAALPAQVSPAQKAAIVVRFLMTEGAELPLSELPEHLQAELAQQMGALRRIDRDTLVGVIEEFASELAATGLTFPEGIAGALSALDGQISANAAAQLRKRSGVRDSGDPWQRLSAMPPEELAQLIDEESTEIAAVLISKINVKTAAAVLGHLPGAKARRITYAVSQTGEVTPDAVDRIGRALLEQLDDAPQQAFASPPEERVGAILNFSRSAMRDDLLGGLEEEDSGFASEVRKSIFTFKHIAARLDPRDVPALTRSVASETLVKALAAAKTPELEASAEHILSNMSGRMAEQLRDEVSEVDALSEEEGESAMTDVVGAVQSLVESGEILLLEDRESAAPADT